MFTSAKDPYRYTVKDNFIDFSESGNLENIYQIEVKHSPKDYPIMLSANLLQEIRGRSYFEYIVSLTKKC